jgi:hypothetical protein
MLERRLAEWLKAAAPAPAPDFAERVLNRTGTTPQRSPTTGWRLAALTAASAAVLLAAVIIGLQAGRFMIGPPPPGEEPEITAPATPVPTPLPVTPAPSPSPQPAPTPTEETGFEDGLRCTNVEDGYSVSYPGDWHANEEVQSSEGLDGVSACLMFGPEPLQVLPHAGPPPGAVIIIQPVSQAPAVIGEVTLEERTKVDGRDATVREFHAAEPHMAAGALVYQYLVELDDGWLLLVATDSTRDGDYVGHRDILDRMMQTLEFGG